MRSVLEPIAKVDGVLGAALVNQQGGLIAHELTPPYEPMLFEEVLTLLRGATDYFAGIERFEAPENLVLRFERGTVLVRNVDLQQIIAVSSNAASIPMLEVALNVAELKLKRQREQSSSSSSLGTRADSQRSEPIRLEAVRRPTGGQDMSTSVSAGMSWSADPGNSGAGARAPSSTPEVGIKVMKHVLNVYTRYMGPPARKILERELSALGESPKTIQAAQFAQLIRAAARKIEDNQMRQDFLREVLG